LSQRAGKNLVLPSETVMLMLDLRIRLALAVGKLTGRTFRPNISLERLRAGFQELTLRYGVPDPGGVKTRDVTIPASDGASIGARLYRSTEAGDALLPLLVYYHGGGWVIGDIAGYDNLCRFFARAGALAVLSVDYRLGPEHRFPRAHEDGIDAYAWANEHATALTALSARIAVGGDSAGGGIATTISAYAVDRGLPRPAYQLLIYPPTDGTERFPSRRAFSRGVPLTTAMLAYFRAYYYTSPDDARSPLITTLDAPHPGRVPATYLLAARYDPLVDEGHAYIERLRAAGVPVTYDLRTTLPHGFIQFAGIAPAARRALYDGITATAAALQSSCSVS
jgi:acetyl esterase